MIAFNPLCNHFLSAVMLFAIFCNHAITVLSLRSLRFTTPVLRRMCLKGPWDSVAFSSGSHGLQRWYKETWESRLGLHIESPPHIHFLCRSKLTKNSPYKLICTTDLHDQKIWLFAPHHLSVQKVQTSLITQNCVQVSPPLAKIIKTLSLFTER